MEKASCGCNGKHAMSAFTVLYDNKTWDSSCLIMHLSRRHRESNVTIVHAYKRMQQLRKKVANLACTHCNKPVGNKFHFHGNGIYCQPCFVEVGGES